MTLWIGLVLLPLDNHGDFFNSFRSLLLSSSAAYTTSDVERTRVKLQILDQETSVHIRHFLHAHNGTSAMIAIYDDKNELVFVNVYKSRPYDQSSNKQAFNENHAEKFLLADQSRIISKLQEATMKMPEGKFRVCIFQSNSPCEPCSHDFIKFRQQINIPGIIEFQVSRIWKLWRNKEGLRRMFSSRGGDGSPCFILKAIDWFQFYDVIYEWVRRKTESNNETNVPFSPATPKEIWAHLYEVTSSAVDLACEESCKVQGKVNELYSDWTHFPYVPQQKSTDDDLQCGSSKPVFYCRYCEKYGHVRYFCWKRKKDKRKEQ